MIVVVLGMHKSGTTLVASLLHGAGISMLDDDQPTSGGYDDGVFFERASAHRLNLEMLAAAPNDKLGLADATSILCEQATEDAMRRVVTTSGDGDWGFKDPRTLLTYSNWARVLPEHLVVGVYRPVRDLWPRFRYAGIRRAHTNPALAGCLVRRWREHNRLLLDIVDRDPARSILLGYDELMAGTDELDRLARFIGRAVPDSRTLELHRSRGLRSPVISAALVIDRVRHDPSATEIGRRLHERRNREVVAG